MYIKDLQSKENIYTSDDSLKVSEDEKIKTVFQQFIWQLNKLRLDFSEKFLSDMELNFGNHLFCKTLPVVNNAAILTRQPITNTLLCHLNWKCYKNLKERLV